MTKYPTAKAVGFLSQNRKEAQEYCSYDETEGTLPDEVQWFCGFEKE